MSLTIALAAPSETEQVAAVLCEAADRLVTSGRPMWYADEVAAERVRPEVVAGRFWLARQAGEVVGTVKLVEDDPLFWPEIAAGDSFQRVQGWPKGG